MKESPFVDFGFPFLRNVFLFQRTVKALLMKSKPLLECGFPWAANPKLVRAIASMATKPNLVF
jgi:hypothetical protein